MSKENKLPEFRNQQVSEANDFLDKVNNPMLISAIYFQVVI